ncbi:21 kDa protein-like [Salvia miltiorrhiza]|uniref:21 kDa protein-like n=1 Tax=Salvia miltiorrhiza TaxID=226208 RepID=UPI0025AC985E|nr:21 kDa protein-like [Salvia miltiorrhiza]
MAKLNTLLLFIFSLHCLLSTAESGRPASTAGATDLIKSECRATRYPALCIECLSNHSTTIQTRRQLAQAALSVSLSRAQSAASFISKLARMRGMKAGEYAAVQDCMENVGATVDQLSRSMKELGSLHEPVTSGDFSWHVGNVQTWVSTALTNENMCLEGFSGAAMDGNVKVAIRRRILNCAQVTSNALALVNRFATRH